MMRVAVVILNWNTKEYLERFLPALLGSLPEEDELIVADNGSTDGSVGMMRNKFPGVRTIAFDGNYGFTGGYNRAYKALEKDPPKYFLLLNSDIEVTRGWLEPLVEWMESHPRCGAVAPKLHSWYERDSFEYAGAAGGFLDRYGYPFCRGRVMKMLEKDSGQYDTPKDVFWATGACLMLRYSLYGELGGLDERYFAHFEEIDLCWRMQLQGWKVTVIPSSTVYHLGGGTLPRNSPRKLMLNYRNSLLTLQKNLPRTVGLKKARKTVRTRMFLDGISAAAYLLTFRFRCLGAVIRAHREFRRMGSWDGAEGLRSITGLVREWVIPMAVFRKGKVFEYIHSL